MQGDDPPYLSEGTAVSAKYKGAFCEAKVSKVVRLVKCKVTFKMGLGAATVHDDNIKGTLRVGQLVQAKHPEKKEFFDATITKVQDCSQYTVVFDDGDITTLKRTALCLKSGRHFNESETLDQLPLTHPEHFGNPVVGGRRGRRNRQLKEDSSEGEIEEDNEPDLEMYAADIGRVVSVESSEKKRNKDNWFPGLIVMPSAQPTVKINVKDEFLVRSFKDGRYYTVPKKEVTEFTKELGAKVENSILAEAVEKALKYLNEDSLPDHWERSILFNPQSQYSDSDDNFTDSSDDEPREEKDHFVAQLYKFMDDSGTPLNKSPMISNRDVDLYRLFRVVHKLGGYNRVTNQNKWRTVTLRLKLPNNQNTFNQVKGVYKKCLYSYESFYRTLGCTMSDHTRTSKKNRGRPLIRDKDRVTPVQSPKPDPLKEEVEEKKDEEDKVKQKKEKKIEEEKKKIIESDVSGGENTEQLEVTPSTSKEVLPVALPVRAKKIDIPKVKEKKSKNADKPKPEKEEVKKEEKIDDKSAQQTRSKGPVVKPKEPIISPDRKVREQKTPMREAAAKNMALKAIKKEEKRGRKRILSEDKSSTESGGSDPLVPTSSSSPVSVGDKLMVYYGPTQESKVVTYEAKVIQIEKDGPDGPNYLVHYTGWNTRYDEWISPQRIAENLSVATKAKRLKHGTMLTAKTLLATSAPLTSTSNVKPPSKRGRGSSITGKATTASEPPRSTTPSSVTSSSSRTKSPATPAVRSRVTRGESNRRARRTSVQTDVSLQSDSESESSECEPDHPRPKSENKNEESEVKPTQKKRLTKTKREKRKEDDDTEKEEEVEKPKKPTRKIKKPIEIKPEYESDDESISHPKGRDFDLNQIRSELKGFTKIKMSENSEKDATSSDDSTTMSEVKVPAEDLEHKKEKIAESTSSSEDVYEFKEPEPFEFESHKIVDDKTKKRFVPRVLDALEKSPRKKSPKAKVETKEEDKKKFKRTPKKDEDDEEEEKDIKFEESTDPFDKLVESPSFHSGKSTNEKSEEVKRMPKVINMDLLFKELPSSIEEDSYVRLNISDTEDTSEALLTNKESLFSGLSFTKSSPNPSLDPEEFTVKSDDRKTNPSDDEESIKATIKMLQFDNDSNDLLINQASEEEEEEETEKENAEMVTINRTESEDESKPADISIEKVGTEEKLATLSKQIAPVFQETDSALLKDLYSPQFLTKVDDIKDINYKIGTKVADSLLQKLSKSKDTKVQKTEEVKKNELVEETQMEVTEHVNEEEKPEIRIKTESIIKSPEPKQISSEPKIKDKFKSEPRKSPRKAISKEFIDESDSDSSDSEKPLIMDEDSQTSVSMDAKPEIKESDSNASSPKVEPMEIEDSSSQLNFKTAVDIDIIDEPKVEIDTNKEDEADPDSLLYCGETIPGSPAPPPTNDPKPKGKSELDMPFASVPCSSTSSVNKNISNNDKPSNSDIGNCSANKDRNVVIPLVGVDGQENRDASAVLDNTPPTTPESILSNLSPRRENCDLSPNTADNDSCKSTEADGEYSQQRRGSTNKVSPFSEEDTMMNSEQCSSGKKRDSTSSAPCRKRRKSSRGDDNVPVKRGRKPNNRSRHNSDSDDTSEHSAQGNASVSSMVTSETRLSRSSRPLRYNFCTEIDPTLDSAERISVIQQKLTDIRKTYANLKQELATIERRRKKIRRREREALKAAKQEMNCT